MKKFSKPQQLIVAFLMVIAATVVFGLILEVQERKTLKNKEQELSTKRSIIEEYQNRIKSAAHQLSEVFHEEKPFVPPPSPNMDQLKKQGCVTDGLLNGWNGSENKNIKMINRSNCYYLHRSIETWLEAPDFGEVEKSIGKLDQDKNFLLGMFLAEAIDTKESYFFPARGEDFDFSKMCRPNSKNFWGQHTCIPSTKRDEYQEYLKYITKKAMDLGVQVFMFGQIFYQDDKNNSKMDKIIGEMRNYADFKGMEILVGAQTNSIENEEYLRQFDFIEGGVGLYSNGKVEDGPCFSRYQTNGEGWCWALLWHEKYKNKANNVLVHLDWSGRTGDDMATFALMSKNTRKKTLEGLHEKFTSQNVGFLMPMLAVLPPSNPGCHGEKKRYYSADGRYTCQDEDAINKIIEK